MSVTIDINANGIRFSFIIHEGGLLELPAGASSGEVVQEPAIVPDDRSWQRAIDDFIAYVHTDGKSKSTSISYRTALNLFTSWLTQNNIPLDIAAITARHVADWKKWQQTTERVMPATINLRLTGVSRFFKWCIEQGLRQTNPVGNIKHLDRGRLRPKALSERETRLLLEEAGKDVRDLAIIELMVGTGLRVSEALNLYRGDLELNEHGGIVTVRDAKGGKFRRVPIPVSACTAIKNYLSTVSIGPDDRLWQGVRGDLITSSAITKLLIRLARRAGIKHVKPHDLRHTFAARYLAANPEDIRGLAALMGHAGLNTTMIYTEPTQEDLARRVERAFPTTQ